MAEGEVAINECMADISYRLPGGGDWNSDNPVSASASLSATEDQICTFSSCLFFVRHVLGSSSATDSDEADCAQEQGGVSAPEWGKCP